MNVNPPVKGATQALLERRAKAVARGAGMAAPVFAQRAENAEIWDVEGRRYIDFAGGIAVLNAGHRNPVVMKRVKEQLDILFDSDGYRICEANSSPGFQGLEKACGISVPDIIFEAMRDRLGLPVRKRVSAWRRFLHSLRNPVDSGVPHRMDSANP